MKFEEDMVEKSPTGWHCDSRIPGIIDKLLESTLEGIASSPRVVLDSGREGAEHSDNVLWTRDFFTLKFVLPWRRRLCYSSIEVAQDVLALAPAMLPLLVSSVGMCVPLDRETRNALREISGRSVASRRCHPAEHGCRGAPVASTSLSLKAKSPLAMAASTRKRHDLKLRPMVSYRTRTRQN
jgi:hypothetical protein